jgi:hypothetical protein
MTNFKKQAPKWAFAAFAVTYWLSVLAFHRYVMMPVVMPVIPLWTVPYVTIAVVFWMPLVAHVYILRTIAPDYCIPINHVPAMSRCNSIMDYAETEDDVFGQLFADNQ